jgi:peroxiredoxin
MKTRYLLCWICAAALAAALPLLAEDPLARAGQDAPLFSGQDQDGAPWRLGDRLGKQIVFLFFYPTDNEADCTAEACSLRDHMAELKQAGVVVVGVSFDDKDTHKDFIFRYNLDFSLLADTYGVIADAYGARMGEHNKMGASAFSADEIKDVPGLLKRWSDGSDPASAFLWKSLSKSDQVLLKSYPPSSRQTQEVVAQSLNQIIGGPSIYNVKRFKGVSLRPETAAILKLKKKEKPTGANLALFNRLLLEDAYPLELARNQRMDRRVSFLVGMDGKIIHVTDSPEPAMHVKELTTAIAKLRDKVSP